MRKYSIKCDRINSGITETMRETKSDMHSEQLNRQILEDVTVIGIDLTPTQCCTVSSFILFD